MCVRADAVCLYFVILIGWIWSASTFQKISALCSCMNTSICEEKCNSTQADHFKCFRRATSLVREYQCLWNVEGYSEYVFLIKQRSCKQKEAKPQVMSEPFSLSNTANVTIYAIAESNDHQRCMFAKFSSSPALMIHCGPPKNVTFKRSSGQMSVTAEWNDIYNYVKHYSLKYRAHNTREWKVMQSQDRTDCIVGNLTSSLSYEIQIQCLETKECPHCPPTEVISVPQELIYAPDMKEIQTQFIHTGKRRVVMKWEYVNEEAVERYNITVQKASGEPVDVNSYSLTSPTITLILCCSAYNISISAFNTAGASPAAHRVLSAMNDKSDWAGALNVTVNSNKSFSLSWNGTLSKKYHCYSVEWWETGEKPTYTSFFEKKSYHEVKPTSVSFQPYKRYHFLLNARPHKSPCNLKNANNSEHTYGRTMAYLMEGTPSTAPGNVSVYNITHSSFVMVWSPMSEMDLRGFLRGYIIRYINMTDHREENITVEPSVNRYELLNLQSRTMYRVQVSAYTAAGEGLSSDPLHIDTKLLDSVSMGGMLAGVIGGIITLLLAVHFCCRFLQRSKNLIWPSVPNPCKSNAVQKIDGGQDLEMMEPLYWQNLEETEERVCVVEVKACPAINSTLTPQDVLKGTLIPVMVAEDTDDTLRDSELTHSASTVTNTATNEALSVDGNTNGSTLIPPSDAINEDTAAAANNMTNTSNARRNDNVSTPNPNVTFMSDYTTMELFQQITRTEVQGPSSQEAISETVPSHPEDYLRQARGYMQNLQQETTHL